MSLFADAPSAVRFPLRYPAAMPDLRLRVYDPTEEELPACVESVEVGDHLRVVVTWGTCIVPVEISRSWGVSMDELVATASQHVARLPVERHTLERDDGAVEATLGHPWASSLITRLDEEPKGPEGAVVAVPRGDLMLSAPVVGAATVDSLELIMLLCDELYDSSDGGISPYVWWSWHDGLYRITDRQPDGTIDISPSSNVSAFYFARALEHLVNPCEECGRTGPAETAIASPTM